MSHKVDDEGYMPLSDYIPYFISKGTKNKMASCETEREKYIWDEAVKECIKATVLDAHGFPGPQVNDIYMIMHNDNWRWEEDEEFMSELKARSE